MFKHVWVPQGWAAIKHTFAFWVIVSHPFEFWMARQIFTMASDKDNLLTPSESQPPFSGMEAEPSTPLSGIYFMRQFFLDYFPTWIDIYSFCVPTGALRHKCPRARHNPMSRIPRGTGSEFKLTDDKPIEWRPQRLATGGTTMIRKPEARQNCSCQRKRVTAGGEDSTPNLDLNWNDYSPHASCPQEGCT